MRWPPSDTLNDDVSVVRALKPHFIARPSQIRSVALFIHDCPKLKLTDDSQIQNFYVTTSTCIRTLLDTYSSISMIMKFCIWANDDSQFRVLVLHARVNLYNKRNDDSQIWTTCTARSRVLHDNLTILRVVMGHVHVHMYGTKFSALVLWRNLTDRIEFMNLPCFCTFPSRGRTLAWQHMHVLYEIQCFCACTDIGGIPVWWRSHGRHEILTVSYFLRATVYLLYDVPRS